MDCVFFRLCRNGRKNESPKRSNTESSSQKRSYRNIRKIQRQIINSKNHPKSWEIIITNSTSNHQKSFRKNPSKKNHIETQHQIISSNIKTSKKHPKTFQNRKKEKTSKKKSNIKSSTQKKKTSKKKSHQTTPPFFLVKNHTLSSVMRTSATFGEERWQIPPEIKVAISGVG